MAWNISHTNNSLYTSDNHCTIQTIYLVYLPVVIVLGSISNIVTIFVFRQRKLKTLSVSFYIYIYAIVNMLNLYLIYGIEWMSCVANVRSPEILADWMCCVYQFMYRMVAYSAIWILVLAMLDRYIAVHHPKRAVTMCQMFMAKLAVVIVFVLLLAVSVHSMWSYELIDTGCEPVFNDLHATIWRWTSATCYVFIPLMMLFVTNFVMIFDKCVYRHRPVSPGGTRDTSPVDLTNTVLALSCTYTMFTTPATVVNILNVIDIDHDANFRIQLSEISNLIPCLNPIIVVFVCMIFSRTFRTELIDSVCHMWSANRAAPEVNLVTMTKHTATDTRDLDLDECYGTLL